MADHSPSVRPFTSECGATTVSPWSSLSAAKVRPIAITSKRHNTPSDNARLVFNLYMNSPFHLQDGHHDPRGPLEQGGPMELGPEINYWNDCRRVLDSSSAERAH